MFFTMWPTDGWLKGVIQGAILATFVQCADASNITQYVDPGLQTYRDDYMSIVKMHCRPDQYLSTDNYFMSIEDIKQDLGYKEGDPRTVGECYNTPPYRVIIHVDTRFYTTYPISQIKSVMFHELRHCLFELGNNAHSKDPKNYFAATLPDHTDEQILYKQVIDDIKQSCGDKK